MTFEEWLMKGVDAGWCSLPVCGTHDMPPMTPEEHVEWNEGFDPCTPVLRLWDVPK